MLDLSAKQSPDRHDRRRDDGEPLLRPLPRLARRRRALPRARAAAGTGRSSGSTGSSSRRSRARRHRREDRAAGRQRRADRTPSAGAITTIPGTAGGRAAPSATAASSPRGPGTTTSRSATTSADDLPFTSQLAREFTVVRPLARVAARPDLPEPQLLPLRAVRGHKTNAVPDGRPAGYPWDTIWERLAADGVDAGYYYTDLPFIALYGHRLVPFQRPIEQYFTDCRGRDAAQRRLRRPELPRPRPAPTTIRTPTSAPGRRSCATLFAAFAESPQWKRASSSITYDEWGGFFDHVAPPVLPRRPAQHGRLRRTSARPGSGSRR